MNTLSETIDYIRYVHRDHRFAMKQQSRIDRSLEAHIRVNVFGFSTFEDEDMRTRKAAEALKLIKLCRDGGISEDYAAVTEIVLASDESRRMWDKIRTAKARALEKAAKALPAAEFVQTVEGVGFLGFAQIVGECGDLSNYANPAKIWKRLGFAPYDGLAMSTWKRTTWRPRALTSEEWIANPFKGERYAVMAQIATWLVTKQVESKEKSGTKHGRAKGPFGEVYVERRNHTDAVHPDWSDGHARADALRITMKRFLAELWSEWRRAIVEKESRLRMPAEPISQEDEATQLVETENVVPQPHAKRRASRSVKTALSLPAATIPPQGGEDEASQALKATGGMPRPHTDAAS